MSKSETKRLNRDEIITEVDRLGIAGEHIEELERQVIRYRQGFEYLVSMLPEDCTAGFVSEARRMIAGEPHTAMVDSSPGTINYGPLSPDAGARPDELGPPSNGDEA